MEDLSEYSICTEERFYTLTVENADSITLNLNNGIYIEGEDHAFSVGMSLQSETGIKYFEGQCSSASSFLYKEDGILLSAEGEYNSVQIEEITEKGIEKVNVGDGFSNMKIDNDGNIEISGYIKGDISGDKNISMKDVQMVFLYVSGKTEFSLVQLLAADVNGDGKVTTNDMQRIFYYVN